MSIHRRFRCEWRSLVWAGGILAASTGFFMLMTRPQMARARELSQTLQEQHAQLANRAQLAEALVQSEAEIAALAARLGDIDERIPAQPLLGGFLEDLARMVQKRELEADTIQPGQPMHLARVDALPIAIQVRGPFTNIHALLQDIENMPRLTRIDFFKVTTDDEHPGIVHAELKLRIFYRSPGEASTG